MLRRELGDIAVNEFRHAVLEGTTTIVPPSDAFGPLLSRVAIGSGYAWRPVATP